LCDPPVSALPLWGVLGRSFAGLGLLGVPDALYELLDLVVLESYALSEAAYGLFEGVLVLEFDCVVSGDAREPDVSVAFLWGVCE
jgi:hypothetical protein